MSWISPEGKAAAEQKMWQQPISADPSLRNKTAHYFLRSGRTDILVEAACGKFYNPGFATPLSGSNALCGKCNQYVRRSIHG